MRRSAVRLYRNLPPSKTGSWPICQFPSNLFISPGILWLWSMGLCTLSRSITIIILDNYCMYFATLQRCSSHDHAGCSRLLNWYLFQVPTCSNQICIVSTYSALCSTTPIRRPSRSTWFLRCATLFLNLGNLVIIYFPLLYCCTIISFDYYYFLKFLLAYRAFHSFPFPPPFIPI
jgi:hypothetical protein